MSEKEKAGLVVRLEFEVLNKKYSFTRGVSKNVLIGLKQPLDVNRYLHDMVDGILDEIRTRVKEEEL